MLMIETHKYTQTPCPVEQASSGGLPISTHNLKKKNNKKAKKKKINKW